MINKKITYFIFVVFFCVSIPVFAGDEHIMIDQLMFRRGGTFVPTGGRGIKMEEGFVLGKIVNFDTKSKDIVVSIGELQFKFVPFKNAIFEIRPESLRNGQTVSVGYNACVDDLCADSNKKTYGCYAIIAKPKQLKGVKGIDGETTYDEASSRYMTHLMDSISKKKMLCIPTSAMKKAQQQ